MVDIILFDENVCHYLMLVELIKYMIELQELLVLHILLLDEQLTDYTG
jgi:hypothetical protein